MSDIDEDGGRRIPRLYVDAAEMRVQPHSFHVVFGQANLDGESEPVIHITMSPSFALELTKILVDAIQPYLRGVQIKSDE